jgi:hypothetical protein
MLFSLKIVWYLSLAFHFEDKSDLIVGQTHDAYFCEPMHFKIVTEYVNVYLLNENRNDMFMTCLVNVFEATVNHMLC